jgi:23S rRNA (cytidine1920-2'-O)/16S rRNA (cytidine1409-2'-O)-methyltransferase
MKKRIDKLMVEKGVTQSRKRAVELIEEGYVRINNKIIKKPSHLAEKDSEIKLTRENMKWVSKAGLKLEKALNYWQIDPKGWICVDIGASTGGFTDFLIENEAKKVYALDVGHDQLAEKLKNNPKVISLEGINARDIKENQIKEKVDFICIDVSFISLDLILPQAVKFLKDQGAIIALIKPQFELGKGGTQKGIVKTEKQREEATLKIKTLAKDLGLENKGVISSPVLGSKGNREFLICLKEYN